MTLESRVTDAILDAGLDLSAVTVDVVAGTASVTGKPALDVGAAVDIGCAFTQWIRVRGAGDGVGAVTAVTEEGSLVVFYGQPGVDSLEALQARVDALAGLS